jgi:hypothetical protein
VYACCALLDGERIDEKVAKGEKSNQDPLSYAKKVIGGADFKKRLMALDRQSEGIKVPARSHARMCVS